MSAEPTSEGPTPASPPPPAPLPPVLGLEPPEEEPRKRRRRTHAIAEEKAQRASQTVLFALFYAIPLVLAVVVAWLIFGEKPAPAIRTVDEVKPGDRTRLYLTVDEAQRLYREKGAEQAYIAFEETGLAPGAKAPALRAFIFLALETKRLRTAREAAQRLAESGDPSDETNALLGRINLLDGEVDAALARAQRLVAGRKDWPAVSPLQAFVAETLRAVVAAGRTEEALAMVPVELAATREDLFDLRLTALQAGKAAPDGRRVADFAAMHQLLDASDEILPVIKSARIRASIHLAEGRVDDGRRAWQLSLAEAAKEENGAELQALATVAHYFQQYDLAARALEELLPLPSARTAGPELWLQLSLMHLSARDTPKAFATAAQMAERFPDNAAALNNRAYLGLLLGKEDPAQAAATMGAVVSRSPGVEAFRLTRAFALAHGGQASTALSEIELMRLDWPKANPSQRFIRAFVLRANGRAAEAREAVANLRPDEVLPEEWAAIQTF